MKNSRAAFVFVFITVVLDMLALGVMIPVLPKLIVQLESGDFARAAKITGFFSMAWAAMQFVFAPLLGVLSDRFGRRPIILLSNLGLGADYVLMALAPSISWLFVGRVISGITAASFPTASAYIADITPPEKRAAKFGMLGAAFGLGFVVGPAVGGLLGGIDLRLPFWVAGALSLLNAAYGFFILPESLPTDRRTKFDWTKANPIGSLKLLRSHPELFGLSLAVMLYYIAHESLPSVFVLYTDHRYHWSESSVGLALALIGVGSVVVQGGLTGPAVKKLGDRGALTVGLLFGFAGFLGYGLAPTGAWFLAATPLISLWGIAGPAEQALMTRRIGENEQGQLQGALGSLRGITGMIGPILFTQVFSIAVARESQGAHPGAPYLMAALLIILSLAVAVWVTSDSTELKA
jgi:DHA1 family tetracycline resistance protein-like MFS transporter